MTDAETILALTEQRDRAREWAVRLEQEYARDHEDLIDARAAVVLMAQELAFYTGGVIDA